VWARGIPHLGMGKGRGGVGRLLRIPNACIHPSIIYVEIMNDLNSDREKNTNENAGTFGCSYWNNTNLDCWGGSLNSSKTGMYVINRN